MAYTKVGNFSWAESQLQWVREDGDREVAGVEDWVNEAVKLRLLLATPAGRASTEVVATLQERYPTREWQALPDIYAHMDEEEVKTVVANSQLPKKSAPYKLTPPEIKGKGLAVDAVTALVEAAGDKNLPCTISAKHHLSKLAARTMWGKWWRLVMHTQPRVDTDVEGEEQQPADDGLGRTSVEPNGP